MWNAKLEHYGFQSVAAQWFRHIPAYIGGSSSCVLVQYDWGLLVSPCESESPSVQTSTRYACPDKSLFCVFASQCIPPPFSKSKSLLNHLCKNRRTTVRGRRKHPYSVSLPLFSGCHNVSMIGCRKRFSRQLFPHRLFSLSLFPPQRTITAAHFFLDTFGH